jgi:hypothetical protein
MASRLSREAIIIFWGITNELDIDFKMKRLQKFSIVTILAWPVPALAVVYASFPSLYIPGEIA